MARYRTPSGPEADFEPGSQGRVLRNRLGIIRRRAMDRAEYDALLRAQTAFLDRIGAETRFTVSLICEMHKEWLGAIYEWAGRFRTVDVSKGGFRWPPAHRVARNMANLEVTYLRRLTPCRPATLQDVAHAIATVHAELLLIHPFRDGNGRLARWLADLMAAQAGLPVPAYGLTGPGSAKRRSVYLEAVRRGYVGEVQALTGFFAAAIERRLRERG